MKEVDDKLQLMEDQLQDVRGCRELLCGESHVVTGASKDK